MFEILPMSGFELRISGVGSDRSANCATTTAQRCRLIIHTKYSYFWWISTGGKFCSIKILNENSYFFAAEAPRGKAGQRMEGARASVGIDDDVDVGDASGRKVQDNQQVESEGEKNRRHAFSPTASFTAVAFPTQFSQQTIFQTKVSRWKFPDFYWPKVR